MIRPRAIRRALLALLLAVQALGAWVPLADARLEAASAAVPLDGERRDDGPRSHAHGQCALCMHLAQREILPTLPAAPDTPTVTVAVPQARSTDVPPAPAAPERGARAPPLS